MSRHSADLLGAVHPAPPPGSNLGGNLVRTEVGVRLHLSGLHFLGIVLRIAGGSVDLGADDARAPPLLVPGRVRYWCGTWAPAEALMSSSALNLLNTDVERLADFFQRSGGH